MKKFIFSICACICIAYTSFAANTITKKKSLVLENNLVMTFKDVTLKEEHLVEDCFYEVWATDSKTGELIGGFSRATSASTEECLGLALGAVQDYRNKYPNAIITYKVGNN